MGHRVSQGTFAAYPRYAAVFHGSLDLRQRETTARLISVTARECSILALTRRARPLKGSPGGKPGTENRKTETGKKILMPASYDAYRKTDTDR